MVVSLIYITQPCGQRTHSWEVLGLKLIWHENFQLSNSVTVRPRDLKFETELDLNSIKLMVKFKVHSDSQFEGPGFEPVFGLKFYDPVTVRPREL